jgi:hypothetical protein
LHPLSEYCLSHLLTAWEGQNKKFKWELLDFQVIKVHGQVLQAVFLGRSLFANHDQRILLKEVLLLKVQDFAGITLCQDIEGVSFELASEHK